MKNLIKIAVLILTGLILAGCSTVMPSWFQQELFVPSDVRGTNIILQVVNATDYDYLDVMINGVRVTQYLDGTYYTFQLGWGLVHGSTYRYWGKTTMGYPKLVVDVYCIGMFRDKETGKTIMLLPEGWRRNRAMPIKEEEGAVLVFSKRSERL